MKRVDDCLVHIGWRAFPLPVPYPTRYVVSLRRPGEVTAASTSDSQTIRHRITPGSTVFPFFAANSSSPWSLLFFTQAPSLRTVGIERVSSAGIDFVMKRNHKTAELLVKGHPISFLHTQGKHLPGERAEQWRGEGNCVALELSDVLDLIPHFTLTSMVASRRLKLEQEQDALQEMSKDVSAERLALLNKSHFVEIIQRTRIELENGDISLEELDQSIRAFRLQPDRVECMLGGPDTIMWDRWEWLRESGDDNNDESTSGKTGLSWSEPKHLLPH